MPPSNWRTYSTCISHCCTQMRYDVETSSLLLRCTECVSQVLFYIVAYYCGHKCSLWVSRLAARCNNHCARYLWASLCVIHACTHAHTHIKLAPFLISSFRSHIFRPSLLHKCQTYAIGAQVCCAAAQVGRRLLSMVPQLQERSNRMATEDKEFYHFSLTCHEDESSSFCCVDS